MHRLQLLLLAVVVKSSVQLQCAAGQPEMVGNTMTCPVPVTTHFHAATKTVNPKVGVPGTRDEEIYPYYKDSTQWSEGMSAKLPTCTKNSDCAFASRHLVWYEYVGICYPAQNKRNSKLIEGGNLCFRARYFDDSSFFVDPNAVGLRNCENSVDCADSKNMGGESFDPWYCNTWQGYFDLNRKPAKGTCMKAKICGPIGHRDTGFASRPNSGSSCDRKDHSTCVDSGLAAVDSSHGYIPRCDLSVRDVNLCCHTKCVAGEARMKDGTFQCDHLITAAMRHSAPYNISGNPEWLFPIEVFPYYKDGNIFQKDSGKELPTCQTNSDCKYLDDSDQQGYCYPARNEATHLVVKNKKFCFKIKHFQIYGPRTNVYIDPKAVGMQFCNNNSDCSSKPHYQGQWYCYESADFTYPAGRKPKGVCVNSKKTA